ncbi:MAG: hypothetical protein J3Q66DRAFT_186630 [Benniella sp.]|nr:MAG: hypothetical protein J3Q66DRAFT_186630 [Benniella sp.]
MAAHYRPCIVFPDELEAIFGSRESSGGLGKQLISQLLLELDNCGQGVVIIAATNHSEAIDTSILRPDRLDRLVYVPPPNSEHRMVILQILKQTTRFFEDIDQRTVPDQQLYRQVSKHKTFFHRLRYPAISQPFRIAPLPTVPPVTTPLFFLGIPGFSTKGYSVGS